jgi:transmembrane sensor
MDELARELATLRENVVPEWSDTRSERLFAGVGQLRRRRRLQKASAGTAVAALTCGLVFWQLQDRPQPSVVAERAPSAPSAASPQPSAATTPAIQPEQAPRIGARMRAQLADGSRVQVTSERGELAIERNQREAIDLRLLSGAAHFDVVPNSQRRFVVAAGSVEVSVIGTVFEVERAPGRVRVTVSRGKVRVRTAAGTALVQGGESSWFDELDGAPIAPAPREATPAPSKSRRGRHTQQARDEVSPRADWRSLSQSGDYEGAYRLLAEGNAVEDDSAALMDAADAARLSGHPEASLSYLRKVLDGHRQSPVAPLAAFTLGRVLLERMGQPSEAADAFATARNLAPQGSLAQDALAREVEAWSKAGHPQEAFERARHYVEKYPSGRRLRAVQLYGGLRAP